MISSPLLSALVREITRKSVSISQEDGVGIRVENVCRNQGDIYCLAFSMWKELVRVN
jgi:hypothetical protein